MRRTFTLQIHDVSDRCRNPTFTDEPTGTSQQILFTNLRRRICVAKQWPFGQGAVNTNLAFARTFHRAWLDDARADANTKIVIIPIKLCQCSACAVAMRIYPNMNRAVTFHVRATLDKQVSVGIISLDPERLVIRDWEPRDTLYTHDDYKQAIGMAMDDAMHECAMETFDNDQLRVRLVEHTRGLIVPRTRVEVHIRDIVPSIRETVTHLVVNVAVELVGASTETVIETRAMAIT